ncbi:PTS fructose transporter subunit IIBC [Erysipelothrix sp. HDW6C]|uniref:PTS fructose transporter subunit IIB n=1 Tax=Erysipelothrix sp. HDW6C TaxID=2714930 RepID=UPI0014086A34|nr:fructose PTS transporter subunit IIB [Erysipelothrix sp. HDW6C]QIK70631.1 PTS fructose transporter subunit IIBC [Erysipelothrix sp. HDW6C]
MKVIGITACPTGIAHTYMAQEALIAECERRGYEHQFETQGSIGVENELSEETIAEADMIILAVSISIEGEERFEDSNIFNAEVNDAISNAGAVIDAALKHYGLA